MAESHNIRVVTLLTGEEYFLNRSMADDDGLSDSSFIRFLIKQEARRRAVAQVSEQRERDAMAEPAQVLRSNSVFAE